MRAIADAQSAFLEWALATPASAEMADLVARSTDLQRETLAGWLALAGRPGDGASFGELRAAGTQMAESMRDAAERLVNSQGDWAKDWTEARRVRA